MNPFCEVLENRLLFYTALPAMPSVQNTDQPVRFSAAADFNGDGRADILTRNYSTGANTIYLTNSVDTSGAGFSIANIKATPNTDWWVAGVGDWNADGKSDILWRNYSSGLTAVWFMDGTNFVSSAALSTPQVALTWVNQGVGDFNGDGRKNDIIFRNFSNGTNVIWTFNGLTRTGSFAIPTTADLNWQALGAADFNNDGQDDIVWRNYSNGQNAVWFFNGVNRIGSSAINPTPAVNTQYEIDGVGDFDVDGKPDLLWRDYASGNDVLWLLNGTTRTSTVPLFPLIST
jgi:hypothetical protein